MENDNARQQAQDWAALLQRLIKTLDSHSAGITNARKREGLTRALVVREATPQALHGKLSRLVDSWGQVNGGVDIDDIAGMASRTQPMPTLTQKTLVAGAGGATVAATISQQVDTIVAKSRDAELGVVDKLRNLLMLLLENIAQLTPESPLLEQQIEQLGHTLSMPLTVRRLEEAERQVRSLMIKQGAIKHSIEEAKNATKEMVATLITRITRLSDSAGGYGEKVDRYALRIRQARDLPELSDTVRQLLEDTRSMTADIGHARDDLVNERRKLREQEERVALLEQELDRVSALVKTDPLTQTLNRRGFEEAYALEVARSHRNTPQDLTVALLDVDDFKHLNDQFGHEAGDLALKHLASILKETLRPTDAVGRYGGEEFALLLPGLDANKAADIMKRVQRELTKRIFLHDNAKVLMTFSAGVADVDLTRGLAEALRRCDAAMYEAKHAGKNRVLVAPPTAA